MTEVKCECGKVIGAGTKWEDKPSWEKEPKKTKCNDCRIRNVVTELVEP